MDKSMKRLSEVKREKEKEEKNKRTLELRSTKKDLWTLKRYKKKAIKKSWEK